MIKYSEFDYSAFSETVKEIYEKESWYAYLKDDEKLKRAFDNSICLLGAFDDDKLVGFVRCVGDGEHIILIQDLIVDRDYQKRGIGTRLMKTVWDKYINVRMFHAVTDINDKADNRFYQSLGMKKLEEGNMVSYFRADVSQV